MNYNALLTYSVFKCKPSFIHSSVLQVVTTCILNTEIVLKVLFSLYSECPKKAVEYTLMILSLSEEVLENHF